MARSEISGTAGIPSPRLLAAARVMAGLSQGQLAALAGVHRTIIARYEAGATLMRADRLEQIMVTLGTCGIRFIGPTSEWDGGVAFVRREPKSDVPENGQEAGGSTRVRKD